LLLRPSCFAIEQSPSFDQNVMAFLARTTTSSANRGLFPVRRVSQFPALSSSITSMGFGGIAASMDLSVMVFWLQVNLEVFSW